MKKFFLGVALGSFLVGLVWGIVDSRRTPEVVQLPPEIIERAVPVEVIKEIPGPATVVERIKWKTQEVPVERPVIHEIATVIEKAAEVGTLFAEIEVEADKHVGRDGDKIFAGWVGSATCRARAAQGDPWTSIVTSPFEQSVSQSLSELAPELFLPRTLPRTVEAALKVTSETAVRGELRWYREKKRWGFAVEADYRLNPDEFSEDQFTSVGDGYYQPAGSVSDIQDRWVLAVGVARRFGGP